MLIAIHDSRSKTAPASARSLSFFASAGVSAFTAFELPVAKRATPVTTRMCSKMSMIKEILKASRDGLLLICADRASVIKPTVASKRGDSPIELMTEVDVVGDASFLCEIVRPSVVIRRTIKAKKKMCPNREGRRCFHKVYPMAGMNAM